MVTVKVHYGTVFILVLLQTVAVWLLTLQPLLAHLGLVYWYISFYTIEDRTAKSYDTIQLFKLFRFSEV